MASKNSIKQYSENSYYHIYNRGVEKRAIFLDQQDFAVFLSYLKVYLTPKNEINLNLIISLADSTPKQKADALRDLRLKNYSDQINLIAYSLMTNHFHFLIHQNSSDAIDKFMTKSYSPEFCRKSALRFKEERFKREFEGKVNNIYENYNLTKR